MQEAVQKMQWSKTILKKDEAQSTVMEYVPNRIELGTPNAALDYLKIKEKGSDFRMSDALREHTGVSRIEEENEELLIEEKTIEKLKEVQETAYNEAYALGLEEGRKEAFDKMSNELTRRMSDLDELLRTLGEMKKEIFQINEAHFVQLTMHIASRLAKQVLTVSNDSLVEIIRSAVGLAADEENVVVQVAKEQIEFLELLKKETSRELEFLKKIKLEPSDSVSNGGCVVLTNYGEVDARIEQRVDQLWKLIEETMPKVKDKIAS